MKPDKKTICSRLEHGIPPYLAQVVPDEMEISAFGTALATGVPLYSISEVLACGTAENIIEYIDDNALICVSGLDAVISKYGDGKGGSLYILRQYIYSGTVEEIMDYFEC